MNMNWKSGLITILVGVAILVIADQVSTRIKAAQARKAAASAGAASGTTTTATA